MRLKRQGLVTRLILVRHAETGCEGRMEGWTDAPLNDTGLLQVEHLSRHLADLEYASVYSSDLQRARQTAAPLVGDRPLIVKAELREMNFGQWENRTFRDISSQYPEESRRWQADPVNSAPPEGETLNQVANRVCSLLEAIRPEVSALIVGHQGSLRALICRLLGMPLEYHWRVRLDHASITIFDTYPEGAILSRLNDCSHLEGLA
jgi:broad specificity phosphatase PhoE